MGYTKEAKTRDNLLKTLVNAHESQISKLKMDLSYQHLSQQQKTAIREEMKVIECLCDTNTNTTDGSSQEAYDSITFPRFCRGCSREMPTDT